MKINILQYFVANYYTSNITKGTKFNFIYMHAYIQIDWQILYDANTIVKVNTLFKKKIFIEKNF